VHSKCTRICFGGQTFKVQISAFIDTSYSHPWSCLLIIFLFVFGLYVSGHVLEPQNIVMHGSEMRYEN